VPAVYVPLPIGNGEQRFNAQPVVQAGGGLMAPFRQVLSLSGYLTIVREPALDSEHQSSTG